MKEIKELFKKYWWIIVILLIIIFSLIKSNRDAKTCKCYEVIGDEDKFWCYTPNGELDTKGECVGEKVYK